jgi:hypothetical protein
MSVRERDPFKATGQQVVSLHARPCRMRSPPSRQAPPRRSILGKIVSRADVPDGRREEPVGIRPGRSSVHATRDGWRAVFWVLVIPVSLYTGWVKSVVYV